MITMHKDTLQETVFLAIGMIEEGTQQYERFCDILMTALGIKDPDGNLSPDYARSPFWTVGEDDVLVPSIYSDLACAAVGDDLSEGHIAEVMRTLGIEKDAADVFHGRLRFASRGAGQAHGAQGQG